MKHVFSNQSECMHVYAQQVQDYGRAASISFRGEIAYSYGHYPIARVIDKEKHIALVQSNNYSVSTGGHIVAARSALGSIYTKLYVPCLDEYNMHEKNINHFAYAYKTGIDKGRRAIKHDYELTGAKRQLIAAKEYCKLVPGAKEQLTQRSRNFVNQNFVYIDKLIAAKQKEIEERKTRLESPEYIAKKTVETERRYGKLITELRALIAGAESMKQAQIDAWKRHEVESAYYSVSLAKYPNAVLSACGIDYRRHRSWRDYTIQDDRAYLRLSLDGTRIETSRQAQVLVEHAKGLWIVIKRSHDTMAEYPGNGYKIDYYTVTKIVNGDLYIGCHYIQYEEIESIAGQLNLI